MKNLNQIFAQLDYAYALLNQQTVIHYNGREYRAAKPVTPEDIAKCKEVLRDTIGDLRGAIADMKMEEIAQEIAKKWK